MHNHSEDHTELGAIVADCRRLLALAIHQSCSISYNRRGNNSVAHALAKKGLTSDHSFFILFPLVLLNKFSMK